MLSCAGADRLQTGMRGAFGKTYGTVARDAHQDQVMEALRRAKYKFPGRQRLCASSNHGFTKLSRTKFNELDGQGRLVRDGVSIKVLPLKGKLDERTLSKLPMSMLGGDEEE